MTVFGIARVKDEADVIEHTVTKMLAQVDEIIVADNGSTDGTREILEQLPVIVVDDPEVAYFQSRQMTALARLAGEKGATWVIPWDADECWYSPFHDRIADLVAGLAPQWLTADAVLYDHVSTALDNAAESNPIERIGWRRREPGPLSKVACRIRDDLIIEQGNHSASYAGGTTKFPDNIVIRHFPYRSPAQFISKVRNGAAAYRATDLPAELGAHWRQYGDLLDAQGEDVVKRDVYMRWFFSADPTGDGLLFDPCP